MQNRWVRSGVLTLAFLALGAAAWAEDAPPRKEAAKSPAPLATPKAATRAAGAATAVTEVVATFFTVDAGGSVQLRAGSDFSAAERASIGFFASPDQDLSAVQVLVWWSLLDAPSFVVQDVILGARFPFSNVGGANVPVYGPRLMLEIRNPGNKPITLAQLTVYAVAYRN